MVGWLLGQETVVLDDFKDYAMPLVELQRLLDWYPLGRGQGRQCAHAGQEVCPYGEYFARGLVPERPMSTARYGAV